MIQQIRTYNDNHFMNILKKQPGLKSPMHNSQAQFEKFSQASPDSRDLNNRETFNKRSKQKMHKQQSSVFKHVRSDTSETAKRPTSFITSGQNARRSAANVHEMDYAMADSNLDMRHNHHNTLQAIELAAAGGMWKAGKCRRIATEGHEKMPRKVSDEDIVRNATTNPTNVLKCHYHPAKDAKYLVEINQDQDILCCRECGADMAAKGCQLEEISSVKSKRNYELDEFLQKSLQSMETIRQCLKNLPDYYSSLKAQIQQQMDCHDDYYNRLIQFLVKKKEETKKVLMNCLNNFMEQFTTMHKDLHAQLSELQANYNEIIVNREDIRKMNQLDFIVRIKKYEARLAISQKALNPEVELWKVQTIDITDFHRDVERYCIKVQQQQSQQNLNLNLQQVLNQIDESSDSIKNNESGLICDQELEWGYKPPKVHPAQPDPNIYFSFQKKNNEKEANSPTFKQI